VKRWWISVVVLVGVLPVNLPAQAIRFDLQGGPKLTVQVEADQQQWITHGGKIWVAAVVDGKLVVQDVRVETGPAPGPGPQPDPGPRPEPQPGPGPKKIIWIEETANRNPDQASAITDQKIRKLLSDAGWSIRVADIDVVDESGKTPSDLEPYIQAAKQKSLPVLVILEGNKELYLGSAPGSASALLDLLRRFGLPVSEANGADGVGKEAPPKVPEAEKKDCPNGNCPAQKTAPTTTTRRRGLFR